jgi:hypothetical protein
MSSLAPAWSSNPHNEGRDGRIGRLFSFKRLSFSFASVSLPAQARGIVSFRKWTSRQTLVYNCCAD